MNFWLGRTAFEQTESLRAAGSEAAISQSTDQKEAWSAVVDWHGPFEDKTACANAAQEMENAGYPNFGLYMVIGRLKSFSVGSKQPLYIGINKDDPHFAESPSQSLHQRIRTSPNLRLIEDAGGAAKYWFGLLAAPRLRNGISDDAENTESCLIHSLNPLINNRQLNRPSYGFVVNNRLSGNKSKNENRLFSKWIPDVIEHRKGSDFITFQWQKQNNNVHRTVKVHSPERRASKHIDKHIFRKFFSRILPPWNRTDELIWDPWFAQRISLRQASLNPPLLNRDFMAAPIIAIALALIPLDSITKSIEIAIEAGKGIVCRNCNDGGDQEIARLAREAQQRARQVEADYYDRSGASAPASDTKLNLKAVNSTLGALNQTALDGSAPEILERNSLPQVFELVADQEDEIDRLRAVGLSKDATSLEKDQRLQQQDRELRNRAARISKLEAVLAQCGETDTCEPLKRDFECLENETSGLSCLVDGEFVSPGRVIHDGVLAE